MAEPGIVRVAAGSLAALQPGEVRAVALPRGFVAIGGVPSFVPLEALIVRDAAGVPHAYLNRCRHLPIPLDGASRRHLSRAGTHFECKTHGALYRFEDGLCVAGPCRGLSLVRLELLLEGDVLYLVSAA